MPDDGHELLTDLREFIRRFVSLSPAQADACSVWVVHTHALAAADFTPYLDISSPVLRSGKTRLLEVLRLLVAKPWFTGRVSGAALARKTEKEQPTLLLDESDAAFNQGDYSEKLRGILNTGFERDGTCSLCIPNGQEWVSNDFSTFSPKAIAGIGNLPSTIKDRAIPIRLKRVPRSQRQCLRKRKVKPEADRLRQRVSNWAGQNLAHLKEAEPQLPEQLNDRMGDVCEPLLAIADCSGGEWPQRIRQALIALCGSDAEPQDGSLGITLLADIQDVFRRLPADRLSTQELLKELTTIETSPWSEADRGKPLTPYGLSKCLSGFDIRPKDIRFGGTIRKGYLRNDFEDAWARYIPLGVGKGQQGQQASIDAGPTHISERQQEPSVAHRKNAKSPVNTRAVADVAPTLPLWSEANQKMEISSNGSNHCWIHPANKTQWWLRGGTDPVCALCHPNPAAN